MAPVVKNLPTKARGISNMGTIPGWGGSPGGGHGNPLQYSCLENPWTEEPGGLPSIGPQRVGHNWSAYTHTHTLLLLLLFSNVVTEPCKDLKTNLWESRDKMQKGIKANFTFNFRRFLNTHEACPLNPVMEHLFYLSPTIFICSSQESAESTRWVLL